VTLVKFPGFWAFFTVQLRLPVRSVRFRQAGVKRVSLGPWLHRAAMQGMLDAIEEVKTDATFNFAAKAPTGADMAKLLK
jgi:2-methylisocitrate lyase-like PEP mutase family enzyme